jgi:hypothetical protein
MSNITPFVKRMRVTGGTIYVFSSATEDIGLNISERNNVVKISNYALLNIPAIKEPDNLTQNTFNVLAIPGGFNSQLNSNSIKDGRVLIAESFQNYALNLETHLIQRPEYNSKLPTTVSERVFWKWLKETGAIRWQKVDTSAGTYWMEEMDSNNPLQYNSVVKSIGEITAGSVRYSTVGTFNETYVMIPTSYGQSSVYFKQIEDDNYKHGMTLTGGGNVYGRDNYTLPHPDALEYSAFYDMVDDVSTMGSYNLYYNDAGDPSSGYGSGWWTSEEGITFIPNSYCTDKNSYLTSNVYNVNLKYQGANTIIFKRSKVDCLSIEYDLNSLKSIYNDQSLTFDKINIENSINDNYEFNAVLIYYSVYTKNMDKLLARNLLGVLFMDAPSGKTSDIPMNMVIPSITKIKSGPTGFGSAYSFRINVKTDNLMDDTHAPIYVDSSTNTILNDFTEVFDLLGKSVNILNKHTSTISYISDQYVSIRDAQNGMMSMINDLEYSVMGISRDIKGSANVIPMFSDGNNPLVDSSLFVYNGKIGVKTNRPLYDFHVDGSLGVGNIYVEKSIKDFNGNILLGVGAKGPFVQEVSLGNSFYWSAGMLNVVPSDVSTVILDQRITGLESSVAWLNTNKTTASYVNTQLANFVKSSSTGDGLVWNNGVLDVSIDIPSITGFATVSYVDSELANKAGLASPIFTGNPQRFSPISASDNTEFLATTRFVHDVVDASIEYLRVFKTELSYVDGSLNLKANIASPIFVGDPQRDGSLASSDNSNKLATTKYVRDAIDSSTGLKAYVDSSIAARDASILATTLVANDVSSLVHSSYMITSSANITANSSTYITVGDKSLDRLIVLNYTTSRGAVVREGEIRILSDGSTLFFTENYQENSLTPATNISGVTFNAVTNIGNPTLIDLNVAVDASNGTGVTFKYNKKIIGV